MKAIILGVLLTFSVGLKAQIVQEITDIGDCHEVIQNIRTVPVFTINLYFVESQLYNTVLDLFITDTEEQLAIGSIARDQLKADQISGFVGLYGCPSISGMITFLGSITDVLLSLGVSQEAINELPPTTTLGEQVNTGSGSSFARTFAPYKK